MYKAEFTQISSIPGVHVTAEMAGLSISWIDFCTISSACDIHVTRKGENQVNIISYKHIHYRGVCTLHGKNTEGNGSEEDIIIIGYGMIACLVMRFHWSF